MKKYRLIGLILNETKNIDESLNKMVHATRQYINEVEQEGYNSKEGLYNINQEAEKRITGQIQELTSILDRLSGNENKKNNKLYKIKKALGFTYP